MQANKELWDQLTTPIYRVIDSDGVNFDNAQVRPLDEFNDKWLYVDDVDGYALIENSQVEFWNQHGEMEEI